MGSQKSEIKWGSILSYVQSALSILISVVYTPIMIRALGKSEYGLYNTITSAISMLSLLSLGMNAGYVRYFAKYKHDGDDDRISRLNGMFLLIFLTIGIIALLCGIFLTNHLEMVFSNGLTEEEYTLAKTLMMLLTINLAVSFPTSVFTNIISANERFIVLKLLGMAKTILSPLVCLPLLLLGVRSIGLVLATLVISLITDAVYIYYVIVRLHNRFVFHGFEQTLFRSIFVYTSFIAINHLVDYINHNIDRLLLGRMVGTAAVAVYAVGGTLFSGYQSLSISVSNVFTPRIHHLYVSEDNETRRGCRFTDLFIKVGRLQCLVLMLFISGLVFFGKSFIYFWSGSGFEDSYYVALLIMIPATIPLMQNVGIEIQRAQNKHQFRSIVYSGMAIINLVITVLLIPQYGAIGAAMGTAISVVIANGIIMNVYYYYRLGINTLAFWKSISQMIIGMLPAWIVGFSIMRFVKMDSVVQMLIWIMLYAFVYCISVWFLSMNRFEKNLVLNGMTKISKWIWKRG